MFEKEDKESLMTDDSESEKKEEKELLLLSYSKGPYETKCYDKRQHYCMMFLLKNG